ncbi:MAG: DUF5916 domain-containing protein [Bacteroidota bacterium]
MSLLAQQEKKQIEAVFTEIKPEIDGILNDECWKNAPVASGFFEFKPKNGDMPQHQTAVRFTYTHSDLYVGAFMFDNSPDSVLKELSVRDNEHVNADYFGVIICPFNDGLNAFGFSVTASGIQSDIKFSFEEEDWNWDAVWQSSVAFCDSGWTVEMMIPYSAIRFPKKDIQVWGINMVRSLRRTREESTWNFVNIEKDDMLVQLGELTGIRDVKPALRLSFMPYISGYIEKDPEVSEWGYRVNGGMDLKYGINESFTLDMTLIPDFGQVQSDDEILNLTPFEVMYEEKRQFFTEGTELFSKCDIFYSRRIGDEPDGYFKPENDAAVNEIKSNPDKTRLINATKLSGRTKSGLGIGMFNAMTSEARALVIDTSGAEREIVTQPFTNYNLVVFDQNLFGNSYISLINTNVRKSEYLANVTGTEFYFSNGKNTFGGGGQAVSSQKYFDSGNNIFGYMYELGAGKISGNLTYWLTNTLLTDTYDPNDMGYLSNNNENTWELEAAYHIYKPFWKLLEMHHMLSAEYKRLYRPDRYNYIYFDYSMYTTFTNYLTFSWFAGGNPVGFDDYYEPRAEGRYFDQGKYLHGGIYLSSDYRKTLAIDLKYDHYKGSLQTNPYGFESMLRPRIRINDHMLIIPVFELVKANRDIGFVSHSLDTIYFGKRDIMTITNTLGTAYIFNPKMSVNLRMRHYWSQADYSDYYSLNEDGSVTPAEYHGNPDMNFNAFTIDMGFKWYFSPGSEINIVWKNAIFNSGDIIIRNFFDNINDTFNAPQINNLSVRILYYLDYNYLRKKDY